MFESPPTVSTMVDAETQVERSFNHLLANKTKSTMKLISDSFYWGHRHHKSVFSRRGKVRISGRKKIGKI